jgi:hypothetical protein
MKKIILVFAIAFLPHLVFAQQAPLEKGYVNQKIAKIFNSVENFMGESPTLVIEGISNYISIPVYGIVVLESGRSIRFFEPSPHRPGLSHVTDISLERDLVYITTYVANVTSCELSLCFEMADNQAGIYTMKSKNDIAYVTFCIASIIEMAYLIKKRSNPKSDYQKKANIELLHG